MERRPLVAGRQRSGTRLVEEALREQDESGRNHQHGILRRADPALDGDIVVAIMDHRAFSERFVSGRSGGRDARKSARCGRRPAPPRSKWKRPRWREKPREWGVPFRCIRVVSDTAAEDMPLDFNLYRDADGRFSRAASRWPRSRRPFTAIPALLRLDRNCRIAAEKLGEFLCRLPTLVAVAACRRNGRHSR